MKKLVMTLVALAAWVAASATVAQAAYPTKPIRFIVPFTAGSGTDTIARAVADIMGKGLGQTIIVDNRPGAGGTIAAAMVAKGEADGYTVLIHSSGTRSIRRSIPISRTTPCAISPASPRWRRCPT